MHFKVAAASLLIAGAAHAAPSDGKTVRTKVRAYVDAHRVEIASELFELLSIPNVARERGPIFDRNAELLVKMLERRGFKAKKLTVGNSPAAVFGSYEAKGASKTVVFYAHYDGQPVHPEEWQTPPFQPALRPGTIDQLASGAHPDWRIYARSSSDDKGPIVGILRAFDALREAGIPPSINIKVFFDGEEEIGSPNLPAILRRYKDELRADLWILCDGPRHQSGSAQLAFGVRGHLGADITVHGPKRGLHSGHYGNWAPNPAAILIELLAGMRSSDGRITIDGISGDVLPISAADREALKSMPDVDRPLLEELMLSRHEGKERLEERILLPALNVRGLLAGGVHDGATNSIPTSATASIEFRLVPKQDPARIKTLVRKHLEQRGFAIVEGSAIGSVKRPLIQLDWGEGYPATRIDPTAPTARAVIQALAEGIEEPFLRLPSLGGSLPIHHIGEILGAPLVLVPTVNYDNNQHASNENLRLAELWKGIEIYAALLALSRIP